MGSEMGDTAGPKRAWIAVLLFVGLVFSPALLQPSMAVAPAGTHYLAPWSRSATKAEESVPQGHKDTFRENLPYRIYLTETLRKGELPLWTPHTYMGSPFAALNHTQVFYPPTWIALPLPPLYAYGWLLAFHAAIAGLGLYTLTRKLGASRTASIVGGITFLANAMFTTRYCHPQFVATGAWLPWIGLGVLGMLSPPGGRRWGGIEGRRWGPPVATAAAALAVLAGHPSVYVYGAVFLTALALWALWDARRDATVAWHASGVAWTIIAALTALTITLVQWFSLYELGGFSEREEIGNIGSFLVRPNYVWSILAWDVRGHPPAGSFWRASGSGLYYEAGQLYTGFIALVLSGIAMAKRRGPALWLGLVAAACMVTMTNGQVYRFLYDWVPLFRFSFINRLAISWYLCVAVMAAFGADALEQTWREASPSALRRVGWVVGGVLATLALAKFGYDGMLEVDGISRGKRSEVTYDAFVVMAGLGAAFSVLAAVAPGRARFGAWAVVALVAADIGWFSTSHLVVRDADRLFRSTPALEKLGSRPTPNRIARLDPKRTNSRSGVFPSNLTLAFGWDDLHGFGPLHVTHLSTLLRSVEKEKRGNPWWVAPFRKEASLSSPVLDLVGVDTVLAMRAWPEVALPVIHEGDITMFANENAFPRATFVPGWELTSGNDKKDADVVSSDGRDLRHVTIVTEPPPEGAPNDPAGVGDVAWVGRRTNDITLRKTGPAAGWVRIAETWYPGWTATVDGAPAQLTRADVALMAVWVPEGDHDVVLTFRPTAWRQGGLWVGFAGLLVLGGMVWWMRREDDAFAEAVTDPG